MNISEMHVWFRQYAQQMGMQNVRAILPEQIDVLINTSITDTLNDIIKKNIGISNDRQITDNSKIGQINALKYLYKIKEIPFQIQRYSLSLNQQVLAGNYTKLGIRLYLNDGYYRQFNWTNPNETNAQVKEWLESLGATNVTVSLKAGSYSTPTLVIYAYFDKALSSPYIQIAASADNIPSTEFVLNPTLDVISSKSFDFKNENYFNGLIKYKEELADYLFLVDFSIDYKSTNRGFNENSNAEYNNEFKTNLFPLRLIDDSYLADTLNDFILKPRLRSPIMVIYNNQMDIYLGKLQKSGEYYTLENGLVPSIIRMSYIAKPAIVKYCEDVHGANVDCDLPEYMHIDILKHAVDLYNISISGNLQSAQAREQQQARENIRNNARQDE